MAKRKSKNEVTKKSPELIKIKSDFENKKKNIVHHKGKNIYDKLNQEEKFFKVKAKIENINDHSLTLLYRGKVKFILPKDLSNLSEEDTTIGKKATVYIINIKTEDDLITVTTKEEEAYI